MKIGFIEVLGSRVDAFSLASSIFEKKTSNIQLSRVVAPELLKVPVAGKKLFAEESVDAVMVFIETHAEAEEEQSLALIHEKMLDVEIYYGKYAFFCILSSGSPNPEELKKQAMRELNACIDLLLHSLQAVGGGVINGSDEIPAAPSTPLSPEGAPPWALRQEDEDEAEIHKLF